MCTRIAYSCSDDCPYFETECSMGSVVMRDAIACIKRLEAQVPRWISVEERLPEGEVLAANFAAGTYGYGEMIIGYIGKGEISDQDNGQVEFEAENDYVMLKNVTHWMPLPEAPKEDLQ